MNTVLKESLEKLWEGPSTHKYLTAISNLKKTYSLKDLVFESAKQASIRSGSESLMGLYSAWQLQQFFFSRNRLLPLVQMMWYGMAEAQERPCDIQAWVGTPPEAKDLNLENFKKAYQAKKLKSAYRLLVFLLRNETERKSVYTYLLEEALKDESNFGCKLHFLVNTWQFCEAMDWQQYYFFWLPLLDELMNGPSVVETHPIAEKVILSAHTASAAFSGAPTSVAFSAAPNIAARKISTSSLLYEELKISVFEDEKLVTLEKLGRCLDDGYSIEEIFENLKIISSELVLISLHKHWHSALGASHYVHGLSDSLSYLSDESQLTALFMAALFCKKISILCKPFRPVAALKLETVDEQNNALFFLEYGIKRGNIPKALGALNCLILQNKVEKNPVFYELLAFLSSMNTYPVMLGSEIQFAFSSLHSHQKSSHPMKDLYLKALTRLLAESPKELTIHNALMNTQQIHMGYYAVGGEFSF